MEIVYGSADTAPLEGTIDLAPRGHVRNASAGLPRASARAARVRVKERAFQLAAVLWCGDLIISFLGLGLGFWLQAWQQDRDVTLLGAIGSLDTRGIGLLAGGSALFSWIMIALRTYELGDLYRVHVWALNLVKSLGIWLVCSLAVVGLFPSVLGSAPAGLFYAVGALGITEAVWRLVAFVALLQPRVRRAATHRIIIVGWNDKAAQLRHVLPQDDAQMAEVIGCVPTPDGRFAVPPPRDLPVLGEYGDLARAAREFGATSVIVADVSCQARDLEALIGMCQREMLDFQMVPAFFPALGTGLQVRIVRGVPLLGVSRLPLDRLVNRILKRTIDIVAGAVGLIIAVPIILVFGLLVYLESPGPILYRQKRTSRSGRTFHIYKIRSMRMDAEAETGAVWCKADDPRRLKIGAFMRRCDIDELPQFWNVLVGEMSLVGPRPERPELIERFKEEIPNYNVRHEIRAGLTGWAQVHGYRGDTDLRKRIEHDLYYLENWNPALDLYCVFATIVRRRGGH